jgi:PPM family protein phosphatase
MHNAHVSLEGPKGANQDSVLPPMSVGGRVFAAVADGVGGQADGKFASETAVLAVKETLETTQISSLKDVFDHAHKQLVEAASKFPLSRNMATTLTVVQIASGHVEVGHVGDSRVYHLRANGLVSRTIDQTEVAELVRQNVFTPEEALRYPRRNVLLSSLSASRGFDFYTTNFDVQPGDMILLCTDGFYNTVRKAELIEIFHRATDAEEFVRQAEALASQRGIRDDASLVVMAFENAEGPAVN